MTYAKPELVALTSALEVIQHVDKGRPYLLEYDGSGNYYETINGYEADEWPLSYPRLCGPIPISA